MGARYYDPATGTFISQDPTGFTNGSTNLYGYAENDPVNHGDPTGCGAKSFTCYPGQFLFTLGVGILAGLVGVGVTAIAGPIAGVVAGAAVAALGAVALNYLVDTGANCQ
jgi:hypothetical protein